MDQTVDSNNNTEVKYSLRPRTAPRKALHDEEETTTGNRKKRIHRNLPLSRHRRRSANARERSRMREINEAFEALRKVTGGGEGPEKTTKITTLRLAIRYISALTEALRDPELVRDAGAMQNPGMALDSGMGRDAGTGRDPGVERDHKIVQCYGIGRNPGILEECGIMRDTAVTAGIESSRDSFGCSSTLLDNVGKFVLPQKEIPLILSNYLRENIEYFPSTTTSAMCDNEVVVDNFDGGSPKFQNCSVQLDCQHQQTINVSRVKSDIPSTLRDIPDLEIVNEPKSNFGNYLLSAFHTRTHNAQDNSEILAGVNTVTFPSLKRCFANSISSNITNTTYFGDEGHHKPSVEKSQFE